MTVSDETAAANKAPLYPSDPGPHVDGTRSAQLLGLLSALSVVFQRWGEYCESAANREVTAAFKWYMQGAAQAHKLNAARIRSALKPGKLSTPPAAGLSGMAAAYETMIDAFAVMASTVEEEQNSQRHPTAPQ